MKEIDNIIDNAKEVRQAEHDKWDWFRRAINRFNELYGYGFIEGEDVKPYKLNRGLLHILCNHSTIRQEIYHLKAELIECLNEARKTHGDGAGGPSAPLRIGEKIIGIVLC